MKWPSQMPKAAEHVREVPAAKHYVAELVNRNSDERFRVVLDKELMRMELYFHLDGDKADE